MGVLELVGLTLDVKNAGTSWTGLWIGMWKLVSLKSMNVTHYLVWREVLIVSVFPFEFPCL